MKQTENVKPTERQTKVLSILPGIIVIAAVSVVVILAGVILMSRYGVIDLPDFIENLIIVRPSESGTADTPWAELLAEIGGKKENTRFSLDSPDFISVKLSELIPSMTPSAYFQLYSLTERSGESEKKTEIAVMSFGDNCRITEYKNGEAVYSVVCGSDKVKVSDRGGDKVYARSEYDALYSPYSDVGLPTAERLTARLAEYETANDSVSVRFDSTSNIFRINCTLSVGTREEYDVKADSGIIVAARLYLADAETPYYELTTEALYTEVEYSASLFDVEN